MGKSPKGSIFQGLGPLFYGKASPSCICQGENEKVSILWDNLIVHLLRQLPAAPIGGEQWALNACSYFLSSFFLPL